MKKHKPSNDWYLLSGSCYQGAGTHPRGPATQSLTTLDTEGENPPAQRQLPIGHQYEFSKWHLWVWMLADHPYIHEHQLR